jgi:hypothetical protein
LAQAHGLNALAAEKEMGFRKLGVAVLTANAAVKLKRYGEAARLLRSALPTDPEGEAATVAQLAFEALLPELSVRHGSVAATSRTLTHR